VRPGQGIGVAVVARPTASKRWRLDRKHDRRRPAAGVTMTEQQRPVRQRKAATRHGLSRRRYVTRPTTSPLHWTPLDSTATPVDGSTTTRPSHSDQHSEHSGNTHGWRFVSSSGLATSTSVTLRRTQHSDNFNVDYCGYCRSPPEQLSYSSSVALTLCLGNSHQPSHRTTMTDLNTPLSQVYQLNDCIQSILISY